MVSLYPATPKARQSIMIKKAKKKFFHTLLRYTFTGASGCFLCSYTLEYLYKNTKWNAFTGNALLKQRLKLQVVTQCGNAFEVAKTVCGPVAFECIAVSQRINVFYITGFAGKFKK